MQQRQPETVTLSDILITDELESRNCRSANYKAENQALRALYKQMVQPETMLQNVVDIALELCQAQTAGISLLETSKNLINPLVENPFVENPLVENHLVEWASLPVPSIGRSGMHTPQESFCWNVVAGTFKQHVGTITPRNFSPCGICLDHGSPQLFSYPERYFTYLQVAKTPIVEELVLPLIVDNNVFGTIWIKSHDQTRHFESEDVRLMISLAEFTTIALLLNQPQTQRLPAKNGSALRESCELSRALMENLPGGATFVVDHDLRYLLAEGEALSQAGFEPGDLIGHTIFEVLPPELAQNYEVLYRQALSGELFDFEHNAHGRSYISRGTPLRDGNGEVYAALAVSYDISDRKQAENALRESSERLRLATEVAQIYSWEFDLKTQTPKFSDNFERITGRAPSQSFVENYEIYNADIHPQDREYVERQVAIGIDPNGDGIFEAEFRTIGIEDKIERWVSVRGQTFFGAQGVPVHYVGVAQDVTDRKQAEADRIQLVQEQTAREEERQRAEALAQLDHAKTEFFSNISHEFRTPLALLLAPLQDALSDCTNPLTRPQRERLEIAHRNAVRLLKLVNTLLDFSRIEEGRMEAVYEPTDLATFTTELASVFHSSIEQAGLKLIVDCPPLPPVYVDREMWEKIVINLLSNAFKFTLEGEIVVRLYQYNDHYVTLQVQDTGAGIAALELPHIFERFYYVRTTQARTHEGSGIGLALVQELIKMHGGTVEVSSVVGQGSCFTAKIPLGTAHLPADHIKESAELNNSAELKVLSAEKEERKNHPLSPQPSALSTHSFILLVDDNADIRDYLKRILSEHVQVEAVANGAAAMAIIEERVPDLVLSDVMMPHLDGFGLLKALRTDPRTKEVPIILLSARADEDSVIKGLQAGADDYLIKPFSATSLVTRVLAHLQLAQLRAEVLHREKTSNRMKDKLLAEVSHELQAPLVSILGWTRLLRSNPSNQSMLVKALETIERNATLQAKLIQDLLDISRITSGKISLNKAPVELHCVIESALATVHQAQQSKDICLECILNPKSITVEGDAERLQQIVLNLLTNAIKFTPEGGRIEVHFNVLQNQAHIEVRDTGIGIEPEFLPYVFETFRQSKNSKTGLGLGLAIARQLVQLHGGTLTAESSGTGQGATFTIKLPLIRANV